MLQKVVAWGGSAQVGLRESGNPASRAMCNVALLAGKKLSCCAGPGEKTESGDPQEMQRHILFVRAAHSV